MDQLALKTSDDVLDNVRRPGPGVVHRSSPGIGLRGRGGARVLRPVKQPIPSSNNEPIRPAKRPFLDSTPHPSRFKKPSLINRNEPTRNSSSVPPHRQLNVNDSERTCSPTVQSNGSGNLNSNTAAGPSKVMSSSKLTNRGRCRALNVISSRPDSKQENRVPGDYGIDNDSFEGNMFNGKKISQSHMESGVPFKGLFFLLDIENKKAYDTLEKDVLRLGGKIIHCVEESNPPFLVVSDHFNAEKLEKLPFPLEQLTEQQLRAVPRLVRESWQLNVRLRSLNTFTDTITKIKVKVRQARKLLMGEEQAEETRIKRKTGPLTSPFMKLEFRPRNTKIKEKKGPFGPWVVEFKEEDNIFKLYLGKHTGKSLFHKATEETIKRRKERHLEYIKHSREVWLADQEGRSPPKLPPKKRKRKEEATKCNICNVNIEVNGAEEHFTSAEHMRAISAPGFFDCVDEMCGVSSEMKDIIKMPPGQNRLLPSPPIHETPPVFESVWLDDQQPSCSGAQGKKEESPAPSVVLDSIIESATKEPMDPQIMQYLSEIREFVEWEYINGKKVKRVETKRGKEQSKGPLMFPDPENPIELLRRVRACIMVDRLSERISELDLHMTEDVKTPPKELSNCEFSFSRESLYSMLNKRAKEHNDKREARENVENPESAERDSLEDALFSHKPVPYLPKLLESKRKAVNMEVVSKSIVSILKAEGILNSEASIKINFMLSEIKRIRGNVKNLDLKDFTPTPENKALLMREFAICKGLVEESQVYGETIEQIQSKASKMDFEPQPWSPSDYCGDSILDKMRNEFISEQTKEQSDIKQQLVNCNSFSESDSESSFDFDLFSSVDGVLPHD